jgi:hypothetical protein
MMLDVPFEEHMCSLYISSTKPVGHGARFSRVPCLAAIFLGLKIHTPRNLLLSLSLSEDVPAAPGERDNSYQWGAAQDGQNRLKAPEGADRRAPADRLVPESQQISQRWGPQMLLDPTKIPMWTGF